MVFVPSHSVVIAGLGLVVFDCVDRFCPVQWRPCWFHGGVEVFLHVICGFPQLRTQFIGDSCPQRLS